MTAIPPNAIQYLPVLVHEQKSYWPNHPVASTLAAQIEQESCISLRHPKCWNPHAELKTYREYGFGLGQVTIAYRADGSERFNVFKELTAQPELQKWTWDNRYDPAFQIRAVLIKNKQTYQLVKGTHANVDHLAFAYAAYNGGMGGVLSDRRVCSATPHCDESIWFGNVEKTSLKPKVKVGGYGQSFFTINRDYVKNILLVRRPKYDSYF